MSQGDRLGNIEHTHPPEVAFDTGCPACMKVDRDPSGGSRRMGDIERWVILVCGECGALVPDKGHSLCSHRADENTGELVKVVPADQRAGAVEALEEIEAAAHACTQEDDDHISAAWVWATANLALHPQGGRNDRA